ncbi:hypothetical protein [Novosphingobium sp.]|uniref:hypothetical protein n=1 Tax=Novosphingobium sp. TaxID=1874826 RepID=UPI001E005002|nr:hypothetical protein [Novosphingobium sp.]MBX9664158.1 hypothetical protein [Novosphingobium sp.]
MSTFRQKVQATTNWVKPDSQAAEEAPSTARRTRARRRASTPVTAHRLFPAFAALWFAALFGLGSLAIPGSMLGAVVLKTGLPALVPAAAPPLGFTAHLLVAFALAMFGAVLGLAVALRLRPAVPDEARTVEAVAPVAQGEADDVYKVRARDAHPDAPPRRPLVLTEALAGPIAEETAEPEPADPLLRRKRSLPASEPVAEAEPWIPEFFPGGTTAVRPLDLSALDLVDPIVQPAPFAEPTPAAEPAPAPAPEAPVIPAAPALIAATPQLPAGFAATLPDVSDGTWSPVAGAPLESLGLVQLIERLALAIAAQKAANEAVIKADDAAEPTAASACNAPAPAVDEPAPAGDSMPGPFSRPHIASVSTDAAPVPDVPDAGSAREALLRRLGALAAGDQSESVHEPVEAPRPFTRPAPVSSAVDAIVPLRPVEPAAPTLMQMNPATASLPESDEALRSALATLKRMTARG